MPPSDPAALKTDENGVSEADLDFDLERDTDVIVSNTAQFTSVETDFRCSDNDNQLEGCLEELDQAASSGY